jgi:hypothetical protein
MKVLISYAIKDMEELEFSNNVDENDSWYNHFGKKVWLFLLKPNMCIPYEPIFLLSHKYPK